MLARLHRRAQEEKGFTLIELLVVVLIIGILAAIAIPAFLGQKRGAQDANAKSLLRNAAIAMESYYSEKQDFVGVTATTTTPPVTGTINAIEPNIAWSLGSAFTGVLAKDDQVAIEVHNGSTAATTNDSYTLRTTSASTKQFVYYRNEDASVKKCNDGTVTCSPNQW